MVRRLVVVQLSAGSIPVGHPILSGVLLCEMTDPKSFLTTLESIAQHVKETKDQIIVRDNPLMRSFTFFAVREGTVMGEWDVTLSSIRAGSVDTDLSPLKLASMRLMAQSMATPEGRGALAMDLTRLGREPAAESEPLSRLARVLRNED